MFVAVYVSIPFTTTRSWPTVVPGDVIEAAHMDGANHPAVLVDRFHAAPAIAAAMLINIINVFNSLPT